MAIGTAALIAGGLGLAAGGVAGAIGSKKEGSSESTSRIDVGTAGASEKFATGIESDYLKSLTGLVDSGPGSADVTNSYGATKSLADMLAAYSKEGGALPTQGDIDSSNSLASKLFAARSTALNQNFQDQTTAAQREAARLGRDVNDPILQAKLRTGMLRQSDLLNAEQGAAAASLAQAMPGQRLAFATDRVNILGGLAEQAFKNRAAIMGYGSQIKNAERDWRLQTGTRYGNSKSNESGGGGIGGAITGALGGLAGGLSIGNNLSGMFGAGGAPALSSGGGMSGPNLGIDYSLPGAPAPANPFGTRTYSLGK